MGEVEPVGCLSCATALFAPGEPSPRLGDVPTPESAFLLIDLPDDLSQAELSELDGAQHGGNLTVAGARPSCGTSSVTTGVRRGCAGASCSGAVVLTVVGIVISAAFAVGARRQLVTLGQLSASGASPATVRTALVLQGTVTGVVGALGRAGAGGGRAARSGSRWWSGCSTSGSTATTCVSSEVAAVALIGVAAATVAALIPARTAARVPTLAALAGRRPLTPVSRRLVTWGVVSMIGGLALLFIAVLGSQSGSSGDLWAFVAIFGGVAELLGACAIAPAVVARLEPLANRLRGSLRLGARSLARHRARTGAVVSAVAAAGALAVAAGGLLLGDRGRTRGRDVGARRPGRRHRRADSDDGWSAEPVYEVSRTPARDGRRRPARGRDPRASGCRGRDDVQAPSRASGRSAPPPRSMPSAEPLPLDLGWWDAAIVVDEAVLGAIRAGDGVRDALDETGVVVLTPDGR